MKHCSFINRLRIGSIGLLLVAASFLLFSFTAKNFTEDFLQQLGISKTSADLKITNSLLGGYLDQYGLQNAKNIATGNRAAVRRRHVHRRRVRRRRKPARHAALGDAHRRAAVDF